jgi:dynactin 1
MRNVTKQSERIEELEKLLSEGTIREKDFSDAIDNLTEEVSTLENEVKKWKKAANDKRAVGEVDRIGAEKAVATAKEVDGLKQEITSLTNAVSFFREENNRIKEADLLAADSWLLEPLVSGKEDEEYEAALAMESQDIFAELMLLATESRVVDLSQTPENRKAWRPARTTPRYQYLEQREQYETLAAWRDDVIVRALQHGVLKASAKPRKSKKARNVFGAKVEVGGDFGLKDIWGKEGRGMEVVIQDPEGWEEFQEGMKFS